MGVQLGNDLAGFWNHGRRNTSPSTSLALPSLWQDNYWSVYAVSFYFFSHTRTSQLQGSKELCWLASLWVSPGVKSSGPKWGLLPVFCESLNPLHLRKSHQILQSEGDGAEACSGIPPRLRKGRKLQVLPWQRTVQTCTAHLWGRWQGLSEERLQVYMSAGPVLDPGIRPWQRLVPRESSMEVY